MKALEECPFCRKKNFSIAFGPEGFNVLCMNLRCGAIGPLRNTQAVAEKAWNQRGAKTFRKKVE